jgi:hypothetical protein
MRSHQSQALLIVVLLLAIAGWIAIQCDTQSKAPMYSSDTTVTYRTIVLPPDTVFLEKVVARVKYRQIEVRDTLLDTVYCIDTVLQSQPFTAYMDTSVGCHKIKLEYNFPEHTFTNLSFVSCPDTLLVQDTVIRTTSTSIKDAVTYGAAGVLGGFVLGLIVR